MYVAFVLSEFVIKRLKHAIRSRCGIQSTLRWRPEEVTAHTILSVILMRNRDDLLAYCTNDSVEYIHLWEVDNYEIWDRIN